MIKSIIPNGGKQMEQKYQKSNNTAFRSYGKFIDLIKNRRDVCKYYPGVNKYFGITYPNNHYVSGIYGTEKN